MRSNTPKWLLASLVLTTSLAPITASANTPAPYGDLNQADAWASLSIQEAQRLGLMTGDADLTSEMILRVTSMQGVTHEYQLVVTP
ncbi:hypothetical protein [Tumebacillus permanentifrigoris]|uniref:Uncharacterized protein n=1 Tax=Tumebacillus permanentifrigoris TaxID=378543 RepID=A0A316D888_9BACL|nr:hypothetical protein [Tumebacillus permanentifrigoris]PWK09648.1 hypothetical protein C7459_11382 [Tumebacillus permanentifrigoris]